MKKLLLLALVAVAASASAQLCVFDTMTGPPTITDTGSTPRAMKGMAFSLGNVSSGPVTITGLDFNLVNVSGTNVTFTSAEVDISFWNTASNATTGTTAAFTNRIATYNIGIAAGTYNSGFYYTFGAATNAGPPAVNLGTGFTFTGTTNLGVQILVKGDQGQGLVAQDFLTPAISTTLAPTIGAYTAGTAGTNGFYRNASQPNATLVDPNTSLLGSDFRVFTGVTNIGLSMRLYTVPEPASMAVLGLGAMALLRRRRNRKA